MHPSVHARSNPDKAAIIVAETGEAISYGALDAASNRAAQLFRSHGLGHEDVVAFMLDNTPHYYGLTWGAQRAGLRYVCISSRLTQDETDYILENSGAQILVVSASLASAAQLKTISQDHTGVPVGQARAFRRSGADCKLAGLADVETFCIRRLARLGEKRPASVRS